MNPGIWEVPLLPALLAQLEAEPGPGLFPFPPSHLCAHIPGRGTDWLFSHGHLREQQIPGASIKQPQVAGLGLKPRPVSNAVPGAFMFHTACPILEQVLRKVTEYVWKLNYPGN